MKRSYDDIIHLPHPTSPNHPRMPMSARAAQFAPFAALSGHGAAIAETSRPTDQQLELTEDIRAELDRKQRLLTARAAEHPEITVTWFRPDEHKDGGAYVTTIGSVKKVDERQRLLLLTDGTVIPFNNLISLEIRFSY